MSSIEPQVQSAAPSNGAADVAHWPVTVLPMDEFNRKLVANAHPPQEGVEVFLGEARFTGPDTVEVFDGKERQTLRFAKALIATGGRARDLPLPGLAEAGYLTNETLFQLTEQPRRLAVIGGGPIGAEMAQTFARLGTYEHEAHAAGIAYEVFHKSLSEVDRARTDGETEGFVKVLVKQGTDKILGATIVASEADEMLNEITLAMVAGLGLKTCPRSSIPIRPSRKPSRRSPTVTTAPG